MQNSTEVSKKRERLENARPEKLQMGDLSKTNYKWQQCKILGKSISIRSYSAACTDGKMLYVHGGLQILKGVLSDFQRINLDESLPKFSWQEVPVKNHKDEKNMPGPRSNHALIYCKGSIYLVGGVSSSLHMSSDIHVYDLKKETWRKLQPQGHMPPIESFGCILQENSPEGDRIIILCGYQGTTSSPTADVYQYNIGQNAIKKLYQTQKDGPVPRSGCACTYDGKESVYVFGGKAEERLNDLWRFDLHSNKYQKIKDEDDMRPNIREGHSMNFYDGKLLVFGGIHEVTWELDDLHIFDTKTSKWTLLEVDSARKKEQVNVSKLGELNLKDISSRNQQCQSATMRVNPKEKNYQHGLSTGRTNYEIIDESLQKFNPSGKMLNEQRKKLFLQKKAQFLKTFQIPENDRHKFLLVEPSCQAMKNSLTLIGNPNPKIKAQPGRFTDFGRTTFSKFMQPLINNSNMINGKRPCARDGHNAVIIGNQIVFFGGDRHQMSFNDLYKLNMLTMRKQFENH